jgi:hypothetical protein
LNCGEGGFIGWKAITGIPIHVVSNMYVWGPFPGTCCFSDYDIQIFLLLFIRFIYEKTYLQLFMLLDTLKSNRYIDMLSEVKTVL